MTKVDAVLEALRKCHQKLRQSKAGGQQLALNAGETFSELANEVDRVIEERRSGIERRKVPRSIVDRRRSERPPSG